MKITFGEMREMGMRGVLVFFADYRCSHSVALLADHWADDTKPSDLAARFVCGAGERRPDFFWTVHSLLRWGIEIIKDGD
ncbi:hypothetical protein AB4Z51_43670 [Bradyrhizobium sp. 2TAF36]|uniref:hypothetical protein n=1 Tax=Bradyrhizobium sp. 2TAF36 TaxID=3233016 RepID=UPI003F908993